MDIQPNQPKRTHLGRPSTTTEQPLPSDNYYTQQVINTILSMMEFTSSVGLQKGYFLTDNIKEVAEVDEKVGWQAEEAEDRDWVGNLVVRMRYGMERRPAEEFQEIVKEIYAGLSIGWNVERVIKEVMDKMKANQQKYSYMLLTNKQLRAKKTNRDQHIKKFLTDIAIIIQQKKIEVRKGKLTFEAKIF